MSKSKSKGKNPSPKGRGSLSPIEIAEIGSRAVVGISQIIQTIGEERRKTEASKLEQQRISSELEAQICATENETQRLLGQYQVELQKIASETQLSEIKAQKEIAEGQNAHEERMLCIQTDHARRMRQLDLIEKIIDVTLRQYDNYSTYVVVTPSTVGAEPLINIQMLNAMNSAILSLNDTLARAGLDAPTF